VSAYLFAVQVGMPEGISANDQQQWLWVWFKEKEDRIRSLIAENAELRQQLAAEQGNVERLEELIYQIGLMPPAIQIDTGGIPSREELLKAAIAAAKEKP